MLYRFYPVPSRKCFVVPESTGCSKSHATHGEMQYKFYFFIIMPISYNKRWKCPSLRSSQRCTRRIMLANTFCNVPVYILSTVRWMSAWSSCSMCGWSEYTVSLRCPHKKKSEDRGGHNLFEMRRPGNRFQVSHGLRDFLNILYVTTDSFHVPSIYSLIILTSKNS
jgi:hypothetical protein